MPHVSSQRSLATCLTVASLVLSARFCTAAPNPVVDGNARFTVITPNCIRLEYAADGHFVDSPSLFAANREARSGAFRLTKSAGGETIDTGTIRLTYTPDGKEFSPANLKASIKRDGGAAAWTPGADNPGNLGGTIRTLDGVSRPVGLGEGVLSRDGWFLLDDSKSPLLTTDWVQSRPATAGTDWYLFGYGSNYRAAMKSLTAVGGEVPLPRRYALGAWYSRYWPYSSDDYRKIIGEYQQHDFPIDNIVMDMDWHRDGWTGWSWNRKLLPDAEQLLTWFHQQGLHVTLNLHPADGVGPQEDTYDAFMRDMGEDPATKKTIPFDAGSKKYMDTMFADVFAPLEKDGADFWWLDWQQYEHTRSVPDLTNLFWLNTLLYDRTAQGDQRGLSFSRWAGWGDHRHPIHFSGDSFTGFSMLEFEVPFTSTAGNVGCFFWSHDIGGHQGGRNEESYTRWVQFGATSPALRSHSTRDAATDRRPWNYPKWAEDSMRISFHLRSQLFPYIYSSSWQTCKDTVPLNRPMYFDNPREEKAYHNAQEFLLGDNMLVAPIVEAGTGPGKVGAQTVWFPAGTWFNTFTGERYDGNSEALVAGDINEFPIFARGGVPIPMQPYLPRMAAVSPETLVVRTYPGAEGKTGSYTLYEDDGVTTGYRKGQFATTGLSYRRSGDTVTVKIGAAKGHYTGQPAKRAFVIELPDTARAESASVNGAPAKVIYDAATFTNRITTTQRPSGSETNIVVTAAAPAGFEALRSRAMARRFAAVLGHPAATLKDALADKSLDTATRNAVFAVAGVGYVAKNDAPYLYRGNTHGYFYAPKGAIDGDKAMLASLPNTAQTVRNGVLDAAGKTIMHRSTKIVLPNRISFQVAGVPYSLPDTAPAIDSLLTESNVAATAKVTVSGSQGGYSGEGAVDGVVGGYPDVNSQEWSSGAGIGATLKLEWDKPQTIDRIVLFDRPNGVDQITSGIITFSDGSTMDVGTLPNDAKTGLTLTFPAKTVTSLEFKVTGVKEGTENSGLAEIGVFNDSLPLKL